MKFCDIKTMQLIALLAWVFVVGSNNNCIADLMTLNGGQNHF